MRNAGLNETRCQNEVSENQTPAADSTTSKVRISSRVTEFCKQTVCPWCYKIDNRGVEPIAARRTSISKSILEIVGC